MSCASDEAADQADATATAASEKKEAPVPVKPVPPAADYSGDWNFKVSETPEGDVTGTMKLTKSGDSFKGTMEVNGDESDMRDLEISGTTMKFNVSAGGYATTVKGDFAGGNMFNGKLSVEGYEFDFSALKK